MGAVPGFCGGLSQELVTKKIHMATQNFVLQGLGAFQGRRHTLSMSRV